MGLFDGLAGSLSKGADWLGSGIGLTKATDLNGGTFWDNKGFSGNVFGNMFDNSINSDAAKSYNKTINTLTAVNNPTDAARLGKYATDAGVYNKNYGWIGKAGSGLASMLNPTTLGATKTILDTKFKYDANKAQKRYMEGQLGIQQQLADQNAAESKFNMNAATEAKKDKEKDSDSMAAGFNRAFGGY